MHEGHELEPAEASSAGRTQEDADPPTPPGSARPLDAIESPDELFDERGEVPLWAPVMQGNVFGALDIPHLSKKKTVGLVVSHPCTMRDGAMLSSRVTIVRIKSDTRPMEKPYWLGNYNLMPLPEMMPESGKNHYADFREITSIDSKELDLTTRVATMSRKGILLLQQRYVCAHTRLVVDLPVLHEQSLSVMVELELQADWVEAGMRAANSNDIKVMDECIVSYHEWLDENDRARRLKFKNKTLFADLRTETRREIRARYSS